MPAADAAERDGELAARIAFNDRLPRGRHDVRRQLRRIEDPGRASRSHDAAGEQRQAAAVDVGLGGGAGEDRSVGWPYRQDNRAELKLEGRRGGGRVAVTPQPRGGNVGGESAPSPADRPGASTSPSVARRTSSSSDSRSPSTRPLTCSGSHSGWVVASSTLPGRPDRRRRPRPSHRGSAPPTGPGTRWAYTDGGWTEVSRSQPSCCRVRRRARPRRPRRQLGQGGVLAWPALVQVVADGQLPCLVVDLDLDVLPEVLERDLTAERAGVRVVPHFVGPLLERRVGRDAALQRHRMVIGLSRDLERRLGLGRPPGMALRPSSGRGRSPG